MLAHKPAIERGGEGFHGYFLYGLHIRVMDVQCGKGEKEASQCRGGLHPREPPKIYINSIYKKL
jgi:hypothetical protein